MAPRGQWANEEGYRVDTPRCHSNGIPLRDFATSASAHRAELPIDG